MDEEHFFLDSSVRGHHVYKAVWEPLVGEMLQVCAQEGNAHDRYAVATLRDDVIVGHVPREFSRIAWYFLQHGGRITCEITGRRKRSEVVDKGLEVPCLYTFVGRPAMIKRLVKVMTDKKCT